MRRGCILGGRPTVGQPPTPVQSSVRCGLCMPSCEAGGVAREGRLLGRIRLKRAQMKLVRLGALLVLMAAAAGLAAAQESDGEVLAAAGHRWAPRPAPPAPRHAPMNLLAARGGCLARSRGRSVGGDTRHRCRLKRPIPAYAPSRPPAAFCSRPASVAAQGLLRKLEQCHCRAGGSTVGGRDTAVRRRDRAAVARRDMQRRGPSRQAVSAWRHRLFLVC